MRFYFKVRGIKIDWIVGSIVETRIRKKTIREADRRG
jgi:hypothetical protein